MAAYEESEEIWPVAAATRSFIGVMSLGRRG
jgi:hypothetical protein